MKGCQRRVIHLKNPGGGLFEEAFFFLRSPEPDAGSDPREMVAEANRILSGCGEGAPKRRRAKLVAFSCGVLLGAAIAVGMLFLIALIVN